MSFGRCPSCQRTKPFPSYILAKSSIHCGIGGENLIALALPELDDKFRMKASACHGSGDMQFCQRNCGSFPAGLLERHKTMKNAPEISRRVSRVKWCRERGWAIRSPAPFPRTAYRLDSFCGTVLCDCDASLISPLLIPVIRTLPDPAKLAAGSSAVRFPASTITD